MFGKQNFIFTLKNKIYEKKNQINSINYESKNESKIINGILS